MTGRFKNLKKKERQLHISNAISGKGEKQRKQAQKLSIRIYGRKHIEICWKSNKIISTLELGYLFNFFINSDKK